MNLERGQVLKGCTGLAASGVGLRCSHVRLLAEKADLKSPLPSLNTDAERGAKLKQVNGKLYTVAKSEFDKSCPAVAHASPSSVVR